ncbi:MAG TPA: helix-turn-helix domain-containing protein, partial [Aggregatilineales bacterium]|nr:helix-turn-helix domain-containing protein [Aggregatilineales bacterium]
MDSYSLGRYLHDAREQKELTLDQATATLKIRRKVLEAFEQGDFSVSADLSQVQIRGFLRNYARFLGLDEDVVMTYYDSAQNPRNRRGRKAKNKKSNGKSSARQSAQNGVAPPPPDPRKLASSIPQNQSRLTLSDERDMAQQRFLRFINLMAVIVVSLIALGVIVFVLIQLVIRPTDIIPQSDILAELPNQPTFTLAPTFTPRFEASPLPESISQYT